MGTLTQDQMKAEIRSALGGRTDLDGTLTQALNLAQTRIARAKLWKELRNSITGTLTITGIAATDKVLAIPTTVRDIYTFRLITSDGRSRKLVKRLFTDWDKCIPEPEYYNTGLPELYTTYASNIEMWRVPDAAYDYVIRAVLWPTAFVSATTTQTSDLTGKDDMLIALTVSYLFNQIGKEEKAARWWAIYRDMLKDATSEDQDDPDMTLSSEKNPPTSAGNYWNDPFQGDMP